MPFDVVVVAKGPAELMLVYHRNTGFGAFGGEVRPEVRAVAMRT